MSWLAANEESFEDWNSDAGDVSLPPPSSGATPQVAGSDGSAETKPATDIPSYPDTGFPSPYDQLGGSSQAKSADSWSQDATDLVTSPTAGDVGETQRGFYAEQYGAPNNELSQPGPPDNSYSYDSSDISSDYPPGGSAGDYDSAHSDATSAAGQIGQQARQLYDDYSSTRDGLGQNADDRLDGADDAMSRWADQAGQYVGGASQVLQGQRQRLADMRDQVSSGGRELLDNAREIPQRAAGAVQNLHDQLDTQLSGSGAGQETNAVDPPAYDAALDVPSGSGTEGDYTSQDYPPRGDVQQYETPGYDEPAQDYAYDDASQDGAAGQYGGSDTHSADHTPYGSDATADGGSYLDETVDGLNGPAGSTGGTAEAESSPSRRSVQPWRPGSTSDYPNAVPGQTYAPANDHVSPAAYRSGPVAPSAGQPSAERTYPSDGWQHSHANPRLTPTYR